MDVLKAYIDIVINILTIEFNLFGYNITLMNVAVYGVVGSILLWFVFKLFK